MLDPGIGVETPGNQRPTWCSGKWIVQAQVYKPAANRSFRPRLTFNVKPFKIA